MNEDDRLEIILNQAVLARDSLEVNSLLRKGVSADGFGPGWEKISGNRQVPCEPPLFLAAWHGYTAIVIQLAEEGASVEIEVWSPRLFHDSKEKRFVDSWTPLMAACARGHTLAAEAIIEYGGDPKKIMSKTGNSCFNLALRGGHFRLAKDLVEKHGVSFSSMNPRQKQEVVQLSCVRKACRFSLGQ